MHKGHAIINNRTNISEQVIIDALITATNRGESAQMTNSAAAADQTSEPYLKVAYVQYLTINGDDVMLTWCPSEDGYARATEMGDESEMCDWETINEVKYI